MKITVKYIPVSEWKYDYFSNQFYCLHDYMEIEKACCTTADADTGYISCGCGGSDYYFCPDCKQDVAVDS